ncbi:O-antigen ligase family protein [Haloarcula salina]|uniref:O-antigen ligase family protein n=1 Tax=Haloarcula salina TaxID=1429914 RepID=UPI003C6F310F
MSGDSWPNLLVTLFLISVLLSLQLPLPGVGSKYASINASDFVVVALGGLFLARRLRSDDWRIELTVPEVTGWFCLLGGWILVTILVAVVREPVSVFINVLWTLKWFEIAGLLVLVQSFSAAVDWDRALVVLTAGGALIAAVAVVQNITAAGTYAQSTVLWRNPNTMAVFLALPALLGLLNGALWVRERPRLAGLSFLAGAVCLVGVLTAGSRSGMITLFGGGTIGVVLLRDKLPVRTLITAVAGTASLVVPILLATRPWLFKRYLPLVLRNGELTLNPSFFHGLESRFQLTQEAIDLWVQQPIFGYGWFASPENPRVGYLDVLYSQLLVDLGAVGFVLAIAFYLVIVRTFIGRISDVSLVVPIVGASWLVGLLAAGIGGAHARVPRLLYILVVLLVAAAALETRDRRRFWA